MQPKNIYTVYFKKLSRWYDPAIVFTALFSSEEYSFWLDSSKVEEGLSQFSYMGDVNGSRSKKIRYNTAKKKITINEKEQSVSIFDYLEKKLNECVSKENVPFDFIGGFVGYFGYELQAECGSKQFHTSQYPDAYFFFIDRFLAFDHKEKEVYLVCLSENKEEADDWFNGVIKKIHVGVGLVPALSGNIRKGNHNKLPLRITGITHNQYLKDIKTCQEHLQKGESYQICLTNQITVQKQTTPRDWLSLYLTLRKISPAPYSAYMRYGDFAILSSSPEMFLKIDKERIVTSKPIKGTIRRGKTEEEDTKLAENLGKTEKDFAENAMIVDLVRNDLGRVCEIGSVEVAKFLAVETYATMHQLVSTVKGKLRNDISVFDVVKAVFPGGSMTGAPKLQAMKIIAEIEKKARGIYSGSLGFLSLNGTVDLSIIIRTIIAQETGVQFGAGGAILVESDPESEYQEMLLKTKALMEAINL
ncbi:MAG TPA: aminodeoxychorismate synthase component I [Candidatus Saccharimonadales bacterium]|nr:aminodeoxychorismate synthase component I [Candidatus Saccharimonadales bacterium]